jgi:hypothetical protein
MRMRDADLRDNPEFTRFLVSTTDQMLQRVEQFTHLAKWITEAYLRSPEVTACECGSTADQVH